MAGIPNFVLNAACNKILSIKDAGPRSRPRAARHPTVLLGRPGTVAYGRRRPRLAVA